MKRNADSQGASRLGLALVLAVASGLAGCAHKPAARSLYDWQAYQSKVSEYLSGDKSSVESQSKAMEDDLKKIQGEGGVVPPGYNAHLGLLYAKQGNLNEFASRLDAEKAQFPESQSFMEFLLRNFTHKNKEK